MQNKQEEIQKIISELSDDIYNINPDQKVGFIVKEIDKIAQEACHKLYNMNDTKHQLKINNDKHGHCC